jgi:hypothetical protein
MVSLLLVGRVAAADPVRVAYDIRNSGIAITASSVGLYTVGLATFIATFDPFKESTINKASLVTLLAGIGGTTIGVPLWVEGQHRLNLLRVSRPWLAISTTGAALGWRF